MSDQEAIRALEQLGFAQIRQRGSHVILKRQTPAGEAGCIVSLHREVEIDTLAGILKQAQVTPEKFLESQ